MKTHFCVNDLKWETADPLTCYVYLQIATEL